MLRVKNYAEFLDKIPDAFKVRNRESFSIDNVGDLFNSELTPGTWEPDQKRSGIVVPFPRPSNIFLSLFNSIPSDHSKLTYMRQTKRDSFADEIVFPETSGNDVVSIVDATRLATFTGDNVPKFISNSQLGTFSTIVLANGDEYRIDSVEGADDANQVVKVHVSDSEDITNQNYSIRSRLTIQPKASGALAGRPTFNYSPDEAKHISIPAVIPVHQETFEDSPMLRGLIDSELRSVVMEVLQNQAVSGDGNAPNMLGVLNNTGITTVGALTGSAIAKTDTFSKVDDLIISERARIEKGDYGLPNGVLFNTGFNSYFDKELVGGSANKRSPFMGYRPGGRRHIFGLPVFSSNVMPGNIAAVVGDFRRVIFAYRKSMTIDVSISNRDDFENLVVSVRAHVRGVIGVLQPKAISKIQWAGVNLNA